ncbi:MAG: 4-hydroxy-tetrahydrodipicolinate synthase [Alphaproteobacteria bacterium]|jgi:4-hydroxy-tetrahydrodipicolinate synthase
MFKGSIVALVTPFKNGAVDEKAFQDLVEWHISEGTHGLVPVGTTGESPTLTHAEHMRVTELCIEAAGGRVPVIAGTGSNATAEAIEFTQHAKTAGADAALVVTPYYNKPTQEGLYAHFKAIHDAAEIPILIYNIPGRSVIDMSQDTLVRLAELPRIVGIKDATASLPRVTSTRLLLGAEFCQLSGEDPTALAFMAHGGHGCISVTANVAPRLCAEFQNAWAEGRPLDALALHDKLMALHIALFLETSPTPAKYALSLLGKCSEEVRLPLVGLGDKTKKRVETALKSVGLVA